MSGGTQIDELLNDINNNKIMRYDYMNKSFLESLSFGYSYKVNQSALQSIAFSSYRNRLYLSYVNGTFTSIYLNTDSPSESTLASVEGGIHSISNVGNYMLIEENDYSRSDKYIYWNSPIYKDTEEWTYRTKAFAWDDVNNRYYYLSSGISPSDLYYFEVNQDTGIITNKTDTPYHGDYGHVGPIIISDDGSKVLLGNGDIYNADDLTFKDSLSNSVEDAIWSVNDGLVYAYNSNDKTIVKRKNDSLVDFETVEYKGSVLKIVKINETYVILTDDNGIAFNEYIPNPDSDNDGVLNENDAFPTDPSASIDNDGDKFPDQWNDGYTQEDSITGLKLDYYPDNLDCNILEHGDGVICDISKTIPSYTPDFVKVDASGIIYLVSNINKRIYRWDIKTKKYINPYILNEDISALEF